MSFHVIIIWLSLIKFIRDKYYHILSLTCLYLYQVLAFFIIIRYAETNHLPYYIISIIIFNLWHRIQHICILHQHYHLVYYIIILHFVIEYCYVIFRLVYDYTKRKRYVPVLLVHYSLLLPLILVIVPILILLLLIISNKKVLL